MSKYITKFNTENDYLNALDGLDYPNVSLIGQTGEVKYSVQHPPFQGKFKATYSNSTTYVLDCNGSTALAQSEVRGGSSPYSSMTTAEIGDCVTSLGDNLFYKCDTLTSVTIPNSVTSIGDGAFSNCSGLTSVTIPDSVTILSGGAFYKCSSLQSVTIPSGVTSIGDYTFSYCTSLTSVTINATTPPTIYSTSFDHTNDCPIYVPSGSVEAYKTAANWSTYASRIQAIPSPSSQQWISVSADSNIPSGTILDLRINSATTIVEDYIITIDTDDASVMIGNLCSGEDCLEYNCEEYECTEYDEETGECIEQGENCIQQGDCIQSECTAHTKAWAWSDDNYNQGYDTESINPLTFGSDEYWYLNAATGMSGFESDGGNTAPFDLQVLMNV